MAYGLRVVPRSKRSRALPAESMKGRRGVEDDEKGGGGRTIAKGPFLGKLAAPVLEGIEGISSVASYPKAAILFVEGQEPSGVFVLVRGSVKLSATSADGRSLILRMAETGEPVGLSASISGKPHEATAEALEAIQASFIPRDLFLDFLRRNNDAALAVVEVLNDMYQATYQEVRHRGLSKTAAERLVGLLLGLTEPKSGKGPIRTTLALTHQEIAEMIGASRETVTRLFGKFKRQGLVELSGSSVTIINKARLEKLFKT